MWRWFCGCFVSAFTTFVDQPRSPLLLAFRPPTSDRAVHAAYWRLAAATGAMRRRYLPSAVGFCEGDAELERRVRRFLGSGKRCSETPVATESAARRVWQERASVLDMYSIDAPTYSITTRLHRGDVRDRRSDDRRFFIFFSFVVLGLQRSTR